MLRTIRSSIRLLAIAHTLARNDALATLEVLGVAPGLVALLRRVVITKTKTGRPGEKLADALVELGPSFVKLGQFFSTRADLLGDELAGDLAELQDHLPPFPFEEAKAMIAEELGGPTDAFFSSIEAEPVSAASIAQVHYAVTTDGREVAIKVLRPKAEAQMRRDLELFYWVAELALRADSRIRRLKPVDLVALFESQIAMEMDLRMEAAACSELGENFQGDPDYAVPSVDWERTARRVLTSERLAGIPLDDREALVAAGHDPQDVLSKAAEIFFNQVFRDGFFHGDQHPGNMFVTEEGAIGAVDFGIMGRLDKETRLVLADMLLALLDQDYRRLAQVQVDAGYLPGGQPLDSYTLALRSICEPIFGRPLAEISFAKLLSQLFQLSESFELEIQPQLTLLQKNMMMAEGISRSLDPTLNIWALAEPLIESWVIANRGPEARVADAAENVRYAVERLPQVMRNLDRIAGDLASGGLRLDPETAAAMGGGNSGRWAKRAFWMATAALVLAIVALTVEAL